MRIGVIGLGRMGGNIARRLMQHGHEAIVFDRDAKSIAALAAEGARGAKGPPALVRALEGPSGAGHFVKMVHNGIEYGLMQAYAEGFDILANAAHETLPAAERFELDVAGIAEVWRRGSVIGSWLLDLTAAALAKDPRLAAY